MWQALILSEIREPLSVIPGQTLRGAKPHKAARIADDAIDRVVSQTLLGRKDSEVRMLRRRISGARNNNQKEPENGTAEFSAEGHRLFHLKIDVGQFRYSILHKYREGITKLFKFRLIRSTYARPNAHGLFRSKSCELILEGDNDSLIDYKLRGRDALDMR